MQIIILILLILGGLYFYSAPFKANVDSAVEENTTWTEERILDNPEIYISDSLRQLTELEASLEGQRLKLNTRKIELERKEKADRANLIQVEAKLEQWIQEYKAGDGEAAILSDGNEYTPKQLRGLILQADERVASIRQRLEYYPATHISVRGKINEVERALALAATERRRILDIKDRVELQIDKNSITEISNSVQGLSNTVQALSNQITPDEIALDDVLAAGSAPDEDQRFATLLAR